MKNFYLLFFFLFLSCVNYNKTYLCGDRECIDKKEYRSYFEKNLIVEVKINNKNKKKNTVDLVALNSPEKSNEKIKKKSFLKKNDNSKKKAIKKELRIKKLKQKELNKIQKKQIKQERKKAKELIKITKLKNKKKEKKKLFDNEIKKNSNDNKLSEKLDKKDIDSDKICADIKNCEIEKITNLLQKKGTVKDFPDITSK